MRFLLDTNAISEPYRPSPSVAFMKRFTAHRAQAVISAITWQELVSGAARLPKGKRRDGLERYHELVRTNFPILPFDEEAASWAGREDARLAAKGVAVSCEDVQIAAIAAVRGLTLVSADAAFSRFERLQIANWAKEGRAR